LKSLSVSSGLSQHASDLAQPKLEEEVGIDAQGPDDHAMTGSDGPAACPS
jgi:hypothetical protein